MKLDDWRKNRSLFRTASLMSTIEMTRSTDNAMKILRLRVKIKPTRRDSRITCIKLVGMVKRSNVGLPRELLRGPGSRYS